MAQEFEKEQKPKVELIKNPKQAEVVDAKPGEGEQSTRRKVVVKRKASSNSPEPATKKASVRVVAKPAKEAQEKSVAAEVKPEKKPVSEKKAVQAVQDKESPSGEETAKKKTPDTKAKREKVEGTGPKTLETERPNVVEGRVGGRPAPRDNKSPFPQRPARAAGIVGGRPVNRPERGPRPSSPGERGSRPGHTGPRTGGPGGGQRAPYGSRPTGPNMGNRPMQAGRPGGQGRPAGQGRPGGMGRLGGFGRPGGASPGAAPIPTNKAPAKKAFKAKRPVYTRKNKEQEMEDKLLQQKKKSQRMVNPVPKSIDMMEVISVSELARKMNLKVSDIIAKLMSMGMMVTINQQIDADTATILASEYGCQVNIVSLYDETLIETAKDDEDDLTPRPPVVAVMGHVDHGKTKLLDAIRSADVASGEFGGITQKIGAYMVETEKGRVTFLDTPGHEAFTMMRTRGAQITDIVILVVAADDGVMPQTVEAINHAKEADVPIIVAINKIDKPEANPDKVKTKLSDLGLMPEDWGGSTQFCEISALKKQGIDTLIDALLLQAEMLELQANSNCPAEGKIIESRIDHGRGVVCTIIVERGTLEVGDSFVAGVWPGKVRAIFNDKGQRIESATPSMPVEVIGFEGVPNAGDPFQIVDGEKTARSISDKRQELRRFEDAKNVKKITLDNLYDTISDGTVQELKVIIKGDLQGSVEAVRSSLEKLSTKEIRLNVIQALPGAINEGDVNLASASNAILIGFNVRPTPQAKALADQEKVDIRRYNIIYKAVEEIQQAMEGMLAPETKEEIIATVDVRDTFKVPKIGTIAGCYVLTGTVKRNASVNVIRDNVVIHTGKMASLKRFKDDAREVAAGYECGIGLEGFDDIQVGDQLEVFSIVEVARKLSKA